MYISIAALVISGISLAVSITNLKRVGNLKKETAHNKEIEVDDVIRHLSEGLEEAFLTASDSLDKKP